MNESHSGDSVDNKTSPSSSTVRYLREKRIVQSIYKSSQSDLDRKNFCCNLQNQNYSVVRSYIDAIAEKQIKLYYTKFTPARKKGQICIIHGYGENTDDYLIMAEFFAKRGYVVNMIDMRGFGYSGGSRVNQPTKKILADIQTLLRNCCQRDLKTFIIAHGLGATFLNALLQENSNLPITGVVNISPLLNFIKSKRKYIFQKLLLKLNPSFFGSILIHNMINPTALSKDPSAIKQKIDSIFWQSFITLRMADQYQKVAEKVKTEGYKFNYPTLFCVGGKDLIQSVDEVKKYYSSLSSSDKHLSIFQQGYHQLHNDYEADELLIKVYNWIESRKNKIKWKQPNTLAKDGIMKRNRLWIRISCIVGFLIFLLGVIKRIRLILKK